MLWHVCTEADIKDTRILKKTEEEDEVVLGCCALWKMVEGGEKEEARGVLRSLYITFLNSSHDSHLPFLDASHVSPYPDSSHDSLLPFLGSITCRIICAPLPY